MFGYVKKKEYDKMEEHWRNLSNQIYGFRMALNIQKEKTELEYKRAEYWKAKALYPNSEPFVEGDMETVKYIKS